MAKQNCAFNVKVFLSTAGEGREIMSFRKGQPIFTEGDTSDALFIIQTGLVRLSARSHGGKEATIDILDNGDFVGKDSVAGQPTRTASASALTDCHLLRIERKAMMGALAQEVTLLDSFCASLLAWNIKYQQDLVEHRCSSSERRLARILLRLSHFDGQSSAEAVVPRISHQTLADMVGTTRSRVCFFLKKFRDAGFTDYDHKSQQLRIRLSLLDFYAR